jgi:hypothetical protein
VSADLDDIVGNLPSDQFVSGTSDWVDPGYSPCLNKRIPDTKRRTIPIADFRQSRSSFGDLGFGTEAGRVLELEETVE